MASQEHIVRPAYYFSFAEMVADEVIARRQVTKLREIIMKGYSMLPHKQRQGLEALITFADLETYPLIMWQTEWVLQWQCVDGLYKPVDIIPLFIIEDEFYKTWVNQCGYYRDLPEGTEVPSQGDGRALLVAYSKQDVAASIGGYNQDAARFPPQKFVYSATAMFVHPKQRLIALTSGLAYLRSKVQLEPKEAYCIVCALPKKNFAWYMPVSTTEAYLALPIYAPLDSTILMLHLNSPVFPTTSLCIRKLHVVRHHSALHEILDPYPRERSLQCLREGCGPIAPVLEQ